MSKKYWISIPAAGLSAIFMIGCGSGSGSYTPTKAKTIEVKAIQPGDEAKIWPATEGNAWTYEVQTQTAANGQVKRDDADITFKISKVEKNGNATVFTIDAARAGDPAGQQKWHHDDKGIYQMWVNKPEQLFSPMQPAILFPIKAGQEFDYEGTGPTIIGVIGKFSMKNKVLAPQIVDTAQGPISGFGVESYGTFTANDPKAGAVTGTVRTTAYWAPGIGLIRYTQTAVANAKAGQLQAMQSLKLKNYVVK